MKPPEYGRFSPWKKTKSSIGDNYYTIILGDILYSVEIADPSLHEETCVIIGYDLVKASSGHKPIHCMVNIDRLASNLLEAKKIIAKNYHDNYFDKYIKDFFDDKAL